MYVKKIPMELASTTAKYPVMDFFLYGLNNQFDAGQEGEKPKR
jgi:hypothetical protein